MEYIEIESYDHLDTEPVASLLDINLNASIIGQEDEIYKPQKMPNQIFVACNPWNYYYYHVTAKGDEYLDKFNAGIVANWNMVTGDMIDYTTAEPKKCQPITYEGLINSTRADVISLISVKFGIPMSDDCYTDVNGLPIKQEYEGMRNELNDGINESIREQANDDILELLEYDSYA